MNNIIIEEIKTGMLPEFGSGYTFNATCEGRMIDGRHELQFSLYLNQEEIQMMEALIQKIIERNKEALTKRLPPNDDEQISYGVSRWR